MANNTKLLEWIEKNQFIYADADRPEIVVELETAINNGELDKPESEET